MQETYQVQVTGGINYSELQQQSGTWELESIKHAKDIMIDTLL